MTIASNNMACNNCGEWDFEIGRCKALEPGSMAEQMRLCPRGVQYKK